MATKSGGYAIIKHDDSDIFAKVKKAYESEKPILFYDDDKTCYFIDTTKKVGDDYVLTKGGKTITITDANTVSSTGSADAPTMENIKDLNGNLRFIDFELTNNTYTGVEFTYSKASLSGTHLMIVLAGSLDVGVSFANLDILSYVTLPDFINSKIYQVFSDVIYLNDAKAYDDAWYSIDLKVALSKTADGICIKNIGAVTNTDTLKKFRIQFDLLIDAE